MSDREVEMGPGTWFAVSDSVLLAREYESVIADLQKLGSPSPQRAFMFTFKGRLNNTETESSFTVVMSVPDAFQLQSDILSGIEALVAEQEADDD